MEKAGQDQDPSVLENTKRLTLHVRRGLRHGVLEYLAQIERGQSGWATFTLSEALRLP